MKKSVKTTLLVTILMLTSLSIAAQSSADAVQTESVPALLAKAKSAYQAQDYLAYRNTLERIRLMRPNNSEYMYQLVIAHALLDDKSAAYSMMLSMQQQGLSYDFSALDATANIRETEAFDYVNDLMIAAGNPMGEAETVFTLPDTVSMPEAIAWDESRQQFLIGTAKEGSILTVDEEGQVTELLRANDENGMWGVYGLLIDQENNRLWVSSASSPSFSAYDPINKGRSALFEFDLKTLELIADYPVPVDGRRNGLIFRTHMSSDRKYVGRALYKWAKKSRALQRATGHGNGKGTRPGGALGRHALETQSHPGDIARPGVVVPR